MKVSLVWKGISGYFLKILISFLLVILVPVSIMGGFWYGMVERQEREYSIDRETERMLSAMDEAERRIHAVEKDLAIFLYSRDFTNYAKDSKDRDAVFALRGEIRTMIQKNPIISSVYIYDTERNKIYNSDSMIYDIDKFYDTDWMDEFEEGLQIQRLPWRVSLNKEFEEKTKNMTSDKIYARKIYISAITQKVFGMHILANIDVNQLGAYIESIYHMEHGNEVFIIAQDGKILYSNLYGRTEETIAIELESANEERGVFYWQDKSRIYFAGSLGSESLYYMESYLTSEFFGKASSYSLYILGICAGLLLFLIILAYIFTNKLYQPVGNLYKMVQKTNLAEPHDIKNELDIMQSVFDEMNNHYQSAVQEEKNYKEFMRMAKLRMMLSGIFSQERFFEENADIYQPEIGKRYQILVCSVARNDLLALEDYEKFSYRLKAVMNSYLHASSKGVFTEVQDSYYTALYVCENDEDMKYIQNLLIQAVDKLSDQSNYFAVSEVFDVTESVRANYELCRNTIKNSVYFERNQGKLMTVMDSYRGELHYEELLNYETLLIKGIVSFDEELVTGAIEGLGEKFMEGNSEESVSNMCLRIMLTLDKEFNLCGILKQDITKDLNTQGTLRDTLKFMQWILHRTIRELKQDSNQEHSYCKKAKQFIEENYMRDMNVTEIADFLGISYAYLSKIFKSQQEGNGKLSEYLNITRINKGKEYLLTTNLTLNDIAEKVGYNNSQSFLRFFKKYTHMTPGEYRKYKNAVEN